MVKDLTFFYALFGVWFFVSFTYMNVYGGRYILPKMNGETYDTGFMSVFFKVDKLSYVFV